MARIECEVWQGEEENDNGFTVTCTYARCGKCQHETMAFGDGDASAKRCLVTLREECPHGETNFYVDGDE